MCIRDRNLERATHAAKQEGAHVQLGLAYTVGRKYTFKYWKSLAKELEELGADSICIKDCLLYTSRCV